MINIVNLVGYSLFLCFTISSFCLARGGDQDAAAERPKGAEKETYLLRYKFKPGEHLDYIVEHHANVDTRIKGNRQLSRSHSVSTKKWTVKKSDQDDAVTIDHSIADVNMQSDVTGRQEIR